MQKKGMLTYAPGVAPVGAQGNDANPVATCVSIGDQCNLLMQEIDFADSALDTLVGAILTVCQSQMNETVADRTAMDHGYVPREDATEPSELRVRLAAATLRVRSLRGAIERLTLKVDL